MITRHPARTSWSRRDMLRGSAAALMGAYGLAPRYGLAADIPMEYDGSKFQMAAPEPNPKRGGVMRYGILNRPPHFDVHQSGTVGNIGTQGCMFDNLIRRDPRDSGKTIVPDLAHSWEIAKDGKTYTFHLRQGVQFHDGTDFTSADIKATFDRIAKPPTGVSIPRTPLFRAVSEINARDKYTVEFKLAAPRSINFMMSAFASGWNVIFSKKTLEEITFYARSSTSLVPVPLRRNGGSRTRSGSWRETRTTGTKACPTSMASKSTISCHFPRSLGPPFCQGEWITPARSTRPPRARRRRLPACPPRNSTRA